MEKNNSNSFFFSFFIFFVSSEEKKFVQFVFSLLNIENMYDDDSHLLSLLLCYYDVRVRVYSLLFIP